MPQAEFESTVPAIECRPTHALRPHGHWDRPEYVIFAAFLRQQCLRERALMLRLRLFFGLFAFKLRESVLVTSQ
jgi:hypothetical protein